MTKNAHCFNLNEQLIRGRIMRIFTGLFVSIVVLFMSGCALSPDTVHLNYESQTNASMIQGANAVDVAVTAHDKRGVEDVVGHKKNGFGIELADINSDTSISDLVKKSVSRELKARGFNIDESSNSARVNINVTEFNNDFKMGFWSGDSVAKFAMMVFVKNNEGNTLYVKNIRAEGRNGGIMVMTGENAKVSLDRAISNGIAKLFKDQSFIDAIMKAWDTNTVASLD